MFVIGGIQKTTLLDFPGKIAAIVFTQGCNFRCGYCHNPDLLEIKQICDPDLVSTSFSKEKLLSFLQSRIGKLDGVVITGGEPTLQSGLYDFIKEIKKMNFAVKLDTNGTNPSIIEKLLNDNLLDYIAMDIKSPVDKYSLITNSKVNIDNIKRSITLIINSNINYEFRTTVVKNQLSFDDFNKIGELIQGAKCYYLQKFNSLNVYNPEFINMDTYNDNEFLFICEILKKYVKFVDFR